MLITSTRAEAISTGAKRYFTGAPCIRGHVSERRTTNGECCTCRSMAKKAWVVKNPDKVKVQKANTYHRHKDDILEKMRLRYAAAPEAKRENANRRRLSNKADHNRRNRQWREANPEKYAAWSKKWQENNPEYSRLKAHEFRQKNPQAGVVKEQLRRARKLRAIPKWFGELDIFVLKEAALLAKVREAIFGFKWHVDHLVPLRAKEASGLHCAGNFAVVPCTVNLQKHRKMKLTTPGAWLEVV